MSVLMQNINHGLDSGLVILRDVVVSPRPLLRGKMFACGNEYNSAGSCVLRVISKNSDEMVEE